MSCGDDVVMVEEMSGSLAMFKGPRRV
jgi:hypothetical protein